MAIKSILSGTGFSALTPDESPQGTLGTTGYDFNPIARWTEPPYSVYRDSFLTVGLMAYHSEGIKEVEFILNGGTGVKVTEQEINPYTNLPEYCVRISKNDLLGATAENLNNLELRAIVRPVVGQVKVMQHDFTGISAGATACRGSDMSWLVGKNVGISGGYGFAFQNQRLRPGKHSFVCSLLKENSVSVKPDIARYVSIDGHDDVGTGSKDLPFETMQKAMESIRDDASVQTNSYTQSGSTNYVNDISLAKVIFMEGEYNPKHYQVGDLGTSVTQSSPGVASVNTWLTVEGTLDSAGNHLTTFSVPEEDSIKYYPQDHSNESLRGQVIPIESSVHPSHINILFNNNRLGNIKLNNIHFKRNNLRKSQANVGISAKGAELYPDPNSSQIGLHPVIDGVWVNNCIIEEEKLGGGFKQWGIGMPNGVDCWISTDCKYYGGKENLSIASFMRNNEINCNVGDVTINHAVSMGTKGTKVQDLPIPVRKIWFDSSNQYKNRDYSKFNGYYVPHRDVDYFKSQLSESIHNGLDFDAASGVGTIWTKIKTDVFNQENWGDDNEFSLGTQWFRNIKEPLDYATWKYHEVGYEYNSQTGEYLPDENLDFEQMKPLLAPFADVPLLSKLHAINPAETKRKFVYGEGIDNPNEPVGDEIFPLIYEPIHMALVSIAPNSLDNTTGATINGYALFDINKRLKQGEDSNNSNKQRYLFRNSGATANASNGHKRHGGTGNFSDSNLGLNNKEVHFTYAWADSISGHTVGGPFPPNGGNDENPSSDLQGATTDNYPVWCYANCGEDDDVYPDMYQLFQNNSFPGGGEVRIENVLSAYDEFSNMDCQPWNMNTGSVLYPYESWTDMAWINCVLAGSNYNYGNNSGNWQIPTKNMLWYNNLMINANWTLNFGNDLHGDFTEGTTGSIGISAGNSYKQFWSDDSYLEAVYPKASFPRGVSFDRMTKNIVLKNNVFGTLSGTLVDLWTNGAGTPSGYTGSSDDLRFHNNYFYRASSEPSANYDKMASAGASAGGFKELPDQQGFMFKNNPIDHGGRSFNSSSEYNYTPFHESGLVGGGTSSAEDVNKSLVPYDLYRTKRVERSTVGPIEPDRLRTFYSTGGNFVTPSGGGYSSTTKTISLNTEDDYNRFRSLYKVQAVDTETGQIISVSTNALRFENRFDDLDSQDSSSESQYEFTKTNGDYGKSVYTPEYLDEETQENLSTSDWLPILYSADRITVYKKDYEIGEFKSQIYIKFTTNDFASAFHTTYGSHDQAGGEQIKIHLPDPSSSGNLIRGISYGSGAVSGNTVKYFLNAESVLGTTVDIAENHLPPSGTPTTITNPL